MIAGDVGTDGPDLGVDRLLLVATGSVATGDLPFWATWLRTYRPELTVDIVLTRGAHRFVRPAALHGRVTGRVLDDTWPESETTARHVDFLEWAQAILIFPATFHYTARLALGLADSPSLLAAQCATVPVVLAPALPPGGTDSEAYRSHVRTLSARRTTRVVPPRPGVSTTTGRPDSWAPALVPDCLIEIARLRSELTGSPDATDRTRYPRSA
ncbi:flavoprotein [Nakamurella flava]|uniref:Flavoprotein n=1 Tax=Nakamurella flava TaxID=2576308 RepID=A0A4U6Q900_9ACTN|nr:flavoprotein [Nakamurella flava]TKV56357.1 flavoprotein [Nakamurella flava]